jgi:putative ABC transport system permease protein
MKFAEVLRMALQAIVRHRIRTILTILGITIGIAAVICAVAIGEGGSMQIRAQLENLGDNMVWIEAGGRNVNGVRTGTRGTKSLTLDDGEAILRSVPYIKAYSPNADGSIQVVYGNANWNTQYRGVSPEFLSVRKWAVAEGTAFTQLDVEAATNVCMLGQTVIQELFGGEDPIGKTIRVGGLPCQVIGTFQPKGLAANGRDQDDFLIMPYTTVMHKIRGIEWLDDIFCSAISPEAVRPAHDAITRLLRQRHRLRPDEEDDFNIRSPEDLLIAQEETSKTFTIMLASIASVSLLVGGLGIMNIMLVSVTERTREIGVRLAVGATEQDVQFQFLSEAVVLSLIGGAAGVLVGIFGAQLFSTFLKWPTAVPAIAIFTAVIFSVATGIFFGFYPAQKAARLDPIEALRYE